MKKSPEELKKEQELAKAHVEAILSQSRPKNLREGLYSGVSNILTGAVGAAGVAVISPSLGFATGLKEGGLIGGALGAAGGAVVGAIGAVGLVLGGAVSGVTQVLRGVAAVPEAMIAPKQGKWWNEISHEWVYTNLSKVDIPESDDDLLGGLESELDAAGEPTTGPGSVKDSYYYDLLEVDPKAESGAIKRKYHILARKYHPDKNDDAAAAEKFKEVAEAYQVLSDPQLREKYDKDGKEGLTADMTAVNDENLLDPSVLMAYLFGSDKFNDYFGRMAVSTSAMLGDSTKLSMQDARKLQERRVARLAITLAKKMEPWTEEDYDLCKAQWETEAKALLTASYGWELLQALGMAYEVAAAQFLGSLENGLGMPGISKWAEGQHAKAKQRKASNKNRFRTIMASLDAMQIEKEYQEKIAQAATEDDRATLKREMDEASQELILKVIWTTTVVDITSTVHETCQMIFFDHSVDTKIRKRRADGVKILGEIFQSAPEPPATEGKKNARAMFEEAGLAATIETMKRKDEAEHKASYGQ